tara:strand:- start:2671 stop:2931 length:261 start_codon:yes stop_codon:yes gene_type:complete
MPAVKKPTKKFVIKKIEVLDNVPAPVPVEVIPVKEEVKVDKDTQTSEPINYNLMRVCDLRYACKSNGIVGYSKKTKKELIEMLTKA